MHDFEKYKHLKTYIIYLICSVNEKAAMLSNYEVYQLLQETENQNKGSKTKKTKPKHLVNLSTICYEVSSARSGLYF